MSLAEYICLDANSHAREELLNYRLLFDMKLAAASHGYHLLTYHSSVDHDGFDIIFDDHHTVRKVQIKTVSHDVTTQSWQIHRSILRPNRNNWDHLGLYHTGAADDTDCGVEGGVILMEFDPTHPDLPVTYFYTDIYVISAIALGHLQRSKKTITAAENLRTQLPNRKLTDKISVVKKLFIKAAAPSNLLALLSLHSSDRINWQNRVILSGQRDVWGPKPDMCESILTKQIADISEKIQQACGHKQP